MIVLPPASVPALALVSRMRSDCNIVPETESTTPAELARRAVHVGRTENKTGIISHGAREPRGAMGSIERATRQMADSAAAGPVSRPANPRPSEARGGGDGGWLYCAGCGNPCRAPDRPGEYACPRCGRR